MATKQSTTMTEEEKTVFELAYDALMKEKDPKVAAELYNALTQDYKGLTKAIDKKLEVANKAMMGEVPKGRMVGEVFVAPTAFEGLAAALRIGAGAYVARKQHIRAQGLSDDTQRAREYIMGLRGGSEEIPAEVGAGGDLDAQEVNWGAEPEMTDSGNMPMIEQQTNEVQPNVQEQVQPPVQYPPDNDAQVNNLGAEPPMQDSRPSPLPFGAGMAPTEQTMESPVGQILRKQGERGEMYPEQSNSAPAQDEGYGVWGEEPPMQFQEQGVDPEAAAKQKQMAYANELRYQQMMEEQANAQRRQQGYVN